MDNYKWPDACVPYSSKELAHAIGILNINWNWCEFILEFILSDYIEAPGRTVARLTGVMNNRTKCDVLTGLLDDFEDDTDLAECIQHFINCFDICRENRNIVMHGLLLEEYPDMETRALVNKKATTVLFERALPVTTNDLTDRIQETSALFNFGCAICDVGKLDEHGKLLPLPDKSPIPCKLTTTLPRHIIE